MDEDWLYLAKTMTVFLGFASLGAAMAFTIALELLQDAALAQGAISIYATPAQLENNQLWQAAKTLQLAANVSAVAGAVLILAFGVAERYGDRLLEAAG